MACWRDLATHRDSESDSEDLSSSDSSLSECWSTQESNLSVCRHRNLNAAEDVGSVEPYMFEPLADSASTDELPLSANADKRSEQLSDMLW